MRHIFLASTPLFLLIGFCFFAGCGEARLSDITQLSEDIETEVYSLDVDELLTIEIPLYWEAIENGPLRAKYFAASIVQRPEERSPMEIITEQMEKDKLGIGNTFEEAFTSAKAGYMEFPNPNNRQYFVSMLRQKLMNETDDLMFFIWLYRETLLEQHGDIPEVHIEVAYELALRKPGGAALTNDEIITAYEARYVLSPTDSVRRKLEKYREAQADGTPFHLIDWTED